MKLKVVTLLTLLINLSLPEAALAQTTHIVRDKNGNPIFQARIFGTTDGAYTSDEGVEVGSTWNLNSEQVGQVLYGLEYWAELLQVVPGKNPAILNVGTIDEYNAYASSSLASNKAGAVTKVNAAINNQNPGKLEFGAHGVIGVGPYTDPYEHSQLMLSSGEDIVSSVIHEVAHALGIASAIEYNELDDGSDDPVLSFPDKLSLWDMHLYDDNNQRAKPGQIIYCSVCTNPTEDEDGEPIALSDVFDARKDQVYFSGKHVQEVLAGAMPGVPLSVMDAGGDIDAPVWSHLELKNSMMSHQIYRNYTTFMEAEAAVLQDLGYQIDRRNFWGYSVYGDNQNFVNDHPFFARNKSGTAYIPNTYNTSTLGLGLHVYGSHNTIVQRADLLSVGAGGGGIRIDGEGNHLTVLPGTRVYADGTYARGVMFAYGKDHSFVHGGDVQALGTRGIAASFDFGHNYLDDINEYRGSYIRTSYGRNLPLLDELNGPLVKTADITGRLAGKYASIYMSDNAYVGQINVMGPAQLVGDIISDYDQVDKQGEQRLTRLTFGYKPDAQGRSTGRADANFAFAYDGNITGPNNLSLELVGGTSQLTGNHKLYRANVAQGATLVGPGNYQINTAGAFTNQGKVIPGAIGQSLTVAGSYVQTRSGELALAFNNQGKLNSLVVEGRADIDGTLSLTPERGYYADGFKVASDKWVTATTLVGSFDSLTTNLNSPTLTVSATAQAGNVYEVSVSRRTDAYSQYGTTSNSRAVGAALSSAASNTPSSMQELLTTLDFSSSDGATIKDALPQLSGEVYASTKGVLMNASGTTRSAVWGRLQQAFDAKASSSIAVTTPGTGQPKDKGDLQGAAAWGYGFGTWANQSSNGNAAKTTSNTGGFITGVDAPIYDTWRLGFMAGYSHTSIKVDDRASSGKSDNYTLGLYTGNEWPTASGALALRSGLAYTWHDQETDRSVAFSGLSDKLSSDSRAGTFQIFGELGYRANLNENVSVEPYANLAHVRLHSDGFTEKGTSAAALHVRSDTMNTTFSTLGVRAATVFELGTVSTTARADLGWRHAFGDTVPYSTASFAGSTPFSAAGSPIGKNTALVETGLDFQLSPRTQVGVAYQGQFGSGLKQNAVNLNLIARF